MGTVSVELRTLYYLARAGALAPSDRDRYRQERSDLFAHLTRSQPGGYAAVRRSPRVPRALPVRLQVGERSVEGTTVQLSSGGFSMYLNEPPPDAVVECSLTLPEGLPLNMPARVVGCVRHGAGAFFVCFALVDLVDYERSLLEDVLLDAAIEDERLRLERDSDREHG